MKSESISSTPQVACLDPLELIDYTEYETVSYHSPSLSPSSSKSQFVPTSVRSSVVSTPTTLPSSDQPALSGPSHQYDLYRQQTGIPQGAIANTLAVNENNGHINRYNFQDTSYFSAMSPSEEFVDFGSAPSRTPFHPSDVEMDQDPAFFYPEQNFVDPTNIGPQNLPVGNVLPPQSSHVGRLWPGMHQQQAALAKAQAQQKQQQAIIAQQRQNAMAANGQQRQPQQQRSRAHTGTDPIVEEKIAQLLKSMRQGSVVTDGDEGNSQNLTHVHRMRKEEEDMDEDERLLASEEGKKLSSKERRQLRNKVSARAFRSRRKEYISQLEGEIAVKVNENMDLKSQNRALMEENTRLSDLTRMLLSSPAFSGFLDTLSSNPAARQAPPPPQQAPIQHEQPIQVRKDVNPYAVQQQIQQQQHIGMVMIPEQAMDFAMLDINADGFGYQPQVYSVLSLPELVIDSSILSGKSSDLVAPLEFDDVKVELPIVERKLVHELAPSAVVEETVDEEFDADPAFALFAEDTTSAPSTNFNFDFDFSTLALNKSSQFELIVHDIESEKLISTNAFDRASKLCNNLDSLMERLEAMFL
ncbi:5526c1c8-0158-4ec6-b9cb-0c230db92b47 [Sclerotinia trifoliorum]|uniref:5526c1c8-0158-4ec6-b9cb-0c230db92b47 n=1 Tax=Sclerotinia trifoliorum TaxID=28548 RepID=A0A8H2VMG1_9HELO|nr:5526c1c8-0158-4ec6-b9cb-0c230db92b47 [Sclerotinia trifoliorum]